MKEHDIHFEERLGLREFLKTRNRIKMPELLKINDNEIDENRSFDYKVIYDESSFKPGGFENAIIMFHGLNERSWDKYLPWANTLAGETEIPVILFPIALHINRSPKNWSNPREMQRLVQIETSLESSKSGDRENSSNENLSFANYALSSRIKADPFRFYISGRETIINVCQLIEEIREGRNPLFSKDCKIDFFAYSIGALLSQVLLMSNPGSLFSESRLFMFCGGSFFNDMNGNSKMIMDKRSFEILHKYYKGKFVIEGAETRRAGDFIDKAFISHIDHSLYKKERSRFYKKAKERIREISLKKDKVIPDFSIKKLFGKDWQRNLTVYDLPFNYSHEAPFPTSMSLIQLCDEKNFWFRKIFSEAADFLKKKQ